MTSLYSPTKWAEIVVEALGSVDHMLRKIDTYIDFSCIEPKHVRYTA
ncbi:hypothetical protein SAMN05444162_1529 [Paenibacillaceae bacterium GAS479]|nr:hypothetical protein SAMN05444162_1529 [Paenibacillaceae bacterium GAS479]